VLIVQGVLSKLVAFINSLPLYWLIIRVINPAAVSGKFVLKYPSNDTGIMSLKDVSVFQ